MAALTPSQTVGPFFDVAFGDRDRGLFATPVAAGRIVRIEGRVLDGEGQPVCDALIELWHPDSGFLRCSTDGAGAFAIEAALPPAVRAPDGLHAPHLVVGVYARGVLTRLLTRIYFEAEPANDDDPVLRCVPPPRRQTLVARAVSADRYRFDIVLQGAGETVFFDL